jgi:hypothetical protein
MKSFCRIETAKAIQNKQIAAQKAVVGLLCVVPGLPTVVSRFRLRLRRFHDI